MIDYDKPLDKVIVKHIPTGEVYEALLLDYRYDGTYIFQITGERKQYAKVIIEDDNFEIDTLFNKSWVVLRRL